MIKTEPLFNKNRLNLTYLYISITTVNHLSSKSALVWLFIVLHVCQPNVSHKSHFWHSCTRLNFLMFISMPVTN